MNQRPWQKKAEVKEKVKVGEKIVNQIFYDCIELTDDPSWKNLLKKISLGSFPKGYGYHDGCLTYKQKKKIIRKEIPEIPVDAVDVVLNFFRSCGLVSDADREAEKIKLQERDTCVNMTWNDIKKKPRLKENLIQDYASRLAEEMKLDKEKKMQLFKIINTGMLLGLFDAKVIVENGRIIQMEDIVYDENAGGFYLDTSKMQIKTSSTKPKKQVNLQKGLFIDAFEKFLETLAQNTVSCVNYTEQSQEMNQETTCGTSECD